MVKYGFEAVLVADDRVALSAEHGVVMARPAKALAGLIEVRGLGIVRLPYVKEARIDLVLDLLSEAEIPRMPSPEDVTVDLNGVTLPRLAASSPERSLDILLTMFGHSEAALHPDMALASVRFDGKTERP